MFRNVFKTNSKIDYPFILKNSDQIITKKFYATKMVNKSKRLLKSKQSPLTKSELVQEYFRHGF